MVTLDLIIRRGVCTSSLRRDGALRNGGKSGLAAMNVMQPAELWRNRIWIGRQRRYRTIIQSARSVTANLQAAMVSSRVVSN